MARKIGIDLGTTNLLICVDNKGILVDEPSIITVDATTKKCIAAGLDALPAAAAVRRAEIRTRRRKSGSAL